MKEAALRPQGLREHRKSLVALACSSVLALGLYVFLEWLFLVTRPSFFSALSWFERLSPDYARDLNSSEMWAQKKGRISLI